MARYTDIDLLIETVEETDWYHISKQGELTIGANSKDDIPLYKHSDITKVLNNAPIADVVPRSEVAREIFAEIEKLSHRFMNDEHYIFGDMVWDIAELKKKYTKQSCHDCASQDGCEKATHIENYQIDSCMEYKENKE